MVSTRVVLRGMSTSFPLGVVAMELSAQLEAREADVELDWAPRDVNQEADDLTNEVFGAFDPALRITTAFEELPWLVLPRLMREGAAFFADMQAARKKRKGGQSWPRRSKQERLRFAEPW